MKLEYTEYLGRYISETVPANFYVDSDAPYRLQNCNAPRFIC